MIGETGSTACVVEADEDRESDPDDTGSPRTARRFLVRMGPTAALAMLAVCYTSGSTGSYLNMLEASFGLLVHIVHQLGIDFTRTSWSPEGGAEDAPADLENLLVRLHDSSSSGAQTGEASKVQEIFSLGESLAWSRISEAGRRDPLQDLRNLQVREKRVLSQPSAMRGHERDEGQRHDDSIVGSIGDEHLQEAPSEPLVKLPLQLQGKDVATVAVTPAVPASPVPPRNVSRSVSPEEIKVRRTLLHSQVKTMKEQGYAVLFAPPENTSEAWPTAPQTVAKRASPANLQKILLGIGLAPTYAASVADHLTQLGIDADNIRGIPPKQLAADLSAPELGLTLGELRRAVTGLWHLSGTTSLTPSGTG